MLSFTGNPLDRAGAARADPAWLAAQAQAGLYLPFSEGRPLLADGKALFLPWQAAWQGATTIFLGLDGTTPLFAVAPASDQPPGGGVFTEMRAAAFLLPARDCAIAGQAKALLDWHRRHGFCPNCGARTEARDGGYRRVCPNCGAEHFPRTDPVVIMLPLFQDKCLIGRNARFVNGLYSAFAGFVEPGETMEEAVKRELLEEVNLPVSAVRYHKSQPWPFPSSLMLGCYADALSPDFRIDGDEIADARWLTRDEARQRLANEIEDEMKMPAVIAIAHHLMRDWVTSAFSPTSP
jgi:NAD+ diphosphatase